MDGKIELIKLFDAVYEKLPTLDERALKSLIESALSELEIKSLDVPSFSFDLIEKQWTQRTEVN